MLSTKQWMQLIEKMWAKWINNQQQEAALMMLRTGLEYQIQSDTDAWNKEIAWLQKEYAAMEHDQPQKQ